MSPGGEALENVKLQARLLDAEHCRDSMFTLRDCRAWIFGAKYENSPTLFGLERTTLQADGCSLLHWNSKKWRDRGIIEAKESTVSAGLYLFQFHAVQPILLREVEKDGSVRDTPTPSPPKESMPYGGFAANLESR